jgi:hypothetical protein
MHLQVLAYLLRFNSNIICGEMNIVSYFQISDFEKSVFILGHTHILCILGITYLYRQQVMYCMQFHETDHLLAKQ